MVWPPPRAGRRSRATGAGCGICGPRSAHAVRLLTFLQSPTQTPCIRGSLRSPRLLAPVFELQPWDSRKLTRVVGHQNRAAIQSRCRDPKVCFTDRLTRFFERDSNADVVLGDQCVWCDQIERSDEFPHGCAILFWSSAFFRTDEKLRTNLHRDEYGLRWLRPECAHDGGMLTSKAIDHRIGIENPAHFLCASPSKSTSRQALRGGASK